MKKNEIVVGGHYRATEDGVMDTFRVDGFVENGDDSYNRKGSVQYDVTNLRTGRTTTFRSAAKFRAPAIRSSDVNVDDGPSAGMEEGEQRSDFPPARSAEPIPGTGATATAHATETDTRACDMPPQPGDDEPVSSEKSDITWGHLFGRKPILEGEQRRPFSPTPVTANPCPATPDGGIICSGTAPVANGRHFTAPSHLRGDQAQAFEIVCGRIDRNKRVTKLCGYAGTGKTYLLAEIAKWARGRNYEVTVCAPTHKAAGVIRSKLAGVDVEIKTIHSLLGLMLVPDFTNDTGGRVLTANDGGKSKVKNGLVICDEASMVGATLKDHIDASPPSVRWLFVGDLAQLPPVGEGVSELLDDPDANLEEIIRQKAGSEIINLSTRVRNGDMDLEYVPGADVGHVDDAEALFQSALQRFDTDDYRADPSHARLLVFRNARRSAINQRMRGLLVGAPEPYVAGEWLVMYAAFSPEKSRLNVLCETARRTVKGTRASGRAWGAFFDAKRAIEGQNVPSLHVSQEVRVLAAEDGVLSLGPWQFGVHRLTVEDRDGGEHELPVLRAEEVESHKAAMAEQVGIAQEHRDRRDGFAEGSADWYAADKERKSAWGVYYSLEETFAQVDYSYCQTTHKAQGSTFDHVFVDVPDLLSSGGMKQRILYTALTRPSKSLTFYT